MYSGQQVTPLDKVGIYVPVGCDLSIKRPDESFTRQSGGGRANYHGVCLAGELNPWYWRPLVWLGCG